MKKNTLAKILGIGAVAAGTLVIGSYMMLPVLAESGTTIPSPIANIAKVFNLDPTKVMQAFNDGKAAEFEARLTTLVTEGKVSAAQKSKIIELHKAIETKRSELKAKGVTREDMHSQMSSVEKALSDYLTAEKLTGIIPMKGNRGMGPEKLENRLTALASQGKITAEQKEKIITLQKAIAAKRDDLRSKNISIADTKTQMAAVEKALTDYLSSQKLTDLIPFGKDGPRGMRP